MNSHLRFSNPYPALAPISWIALIAACFASSSFAASASWIGGSGVSLNTGANWTGGSTPSVAGDIATWDGFEAGNLALTWTTVVGPASGATGGVSLNIAGTNTSSLSLDATATAAIGLGNISIAAGAGAFTIGNGVGTANLILRSPAASTSFLNNSSNTATFRSDVVFANGGGVGNRVVTFDGSGNWALEGTFVPAAFTSASSASLVKNGTGTLSLAGSSTHGGGTTLNSGVLSVANGSALGTGNLAINGSFGTRLEVSNNVALSGPTNINLTGRNNTPDNTSSGASIRNNSGNNSISSNLVFANVGGTNLNLLSAAGTLTLGGNLTTSLATATRTFNFAGAGNFVSNGAIGNGSGTVGIIKNGDGSLTLNGPNTFSGGSTLAAGTVFAANASALGTGTVAIAGGNLTTSVPSLAGVGTVTFSLGGLDLNQSSTGTLALSSGSSFLMSGGTWTISFANTSSYDQIVGSAGGSFSAIGAALTLVGIPDYTASYNIFIGFGSGVASALTITGHDDANWVAVVNDSGVLSFTPIPEPGSVAALFGVAALGIAFVRRRRS